ncbi:hypothetical protein [Halalkalibacterium ligniniphilum]|uniref:hypothetical protein n=1 Tax=Halalkalibacterium ligniniphilum TaxID=1134413 RepID=UPI00034A2CDE|nr:hypothetical protein [Halalkalibacterium ligniniphilum]
MTFKKPLYVLASGFFALWILAACSADEEPTPVDDNDTEEVETDQTDEATEPDATEESESKATDNEGGITEDETLTGQLLDEEGVLGGQVYRQDDMMIGTIMLDAELEDSAAEELAERYAEEIKAQYPDLAVNVQAVKDGENVANITLE